MKVNEYFASIQGEGPLVGEPTIFIRLSGCNLKCDFCDTKYHKDVMKFSMKELVQYISESRIKSITFTGGEPTIQENNIMFHQLLSAYDDFHLAIETNGTILTKFVWDTIVISPKKERIDKDVLQRYVAMENTYFKFVYESKNNKWWEKLIRELEIPSEKIYIMPEGATKKEQEEKMIEVWNYCIRKGYNFSPRIHVLVWDKKKGV
jgi:7-carboxy-7-deazaguanine synthase